MKPSEHKDRYIAPGEYPEFVVFYTAEPYWMEFVVLNVKGWLGDGGLILDDGVDLDHPDGGERIMEGSLKWDGCINLRVGNGEKDLLDHFCGLNSALIIERAFRTIYMLAEKHIAHFDKECAQ